MTTPELGSDENEGPEIQRGRAAAESAQAFLSNVASSVADIVEKRFRRALRHLTPEQFTLAIARSDGMINNFRDRIASYIKVVAQLELLDAAPWHHPIVLRFFKDLNREFPSLQVGELDTDCTFPAHIDVPADEPLGSLLKLNGAPWSGTFLLSPSHDTRPIQYLPPDGNEIDMIGQGLAEILSARFLALRQLSEVVDGGR